MPEPTPAELALLELIADQLADQGFTLGSRSYEPAPLTVDFVFDEARPRPVAIELTRLVNPEERAGGNAMVRHLTDPLNAQAETEHWGSWELSVAIPGHYRTLAPIVVQLIQHGFEIEEGGYASDDLRRERERGNLNEFLATHRGATDAGILYLIRGSAGGDSVSVGGMTTGFRSITGFSGPLLETVYRKADQLAAARPRQTHLVVDVERWDFSRDDRQTLPPLLPDSIDRLWVLHRWAFRPDLPNLWWADRHASDWSRRKVEIVGELI